MIGAEATATMLAAGAIGVAAANYPEVPSIVINSSIILLVGLVQIVMGMLFLGTFYSKLHTY